MNSVQIGAFSVARYGNVVTVTATAKDSVVFDRLLEQGQKLRMFFKASGPSTDWGCDGVGYGAQKSVLQVRLNRSGVTPTSFRRGIAAALAAMRAVRL